MDQTAMLIAAVAALWGAVALLAREIRTLFVRALDDKDKQIDELKADARATLQAKDEELNEWRKRAYMAAEQRSPPQIGGQHP